MQRKRTFEWLDPELPKLEMMEKSGLEYLQAIANGNISEPPILKTLDFKPEQVAKGKVVFSFIPQEFHYNTLGTVHGGVLSAILDTAMGCALHSLLEIGKSYTTLELQVHFLKSVTISSGIMYAEGKVLHSGRRVGLTQATLFDHKNDVFAYSTSTCMFL